MSLFEGLKKFVSRPYGLAPSSGPFQAPSMDFYQVQILHKSLQINENTRLIYAGAAYIEIENSPDTLGAVQAPF